MKHFCFDCAVKGYFLVIFLFYIILSFSCNSSRPTTSFESDVHFQSPGSVVENLASAYQQQNLEQYMSSFSPECRFFDGPLVLWDIDSEEQIHSSMFATATEIELDMQEVVGAEAGDRTLSTVYRYELKLQLPSGSPLTAEGEVRLEFENTVDRGWKIKTFEEETDISQPVSKPVISTDSSNYLPLQVGNKWVYYNRLIPTLPDIEVLVTDSLMLKGNLYYQLEDLGFPFYSSFLRVDSLQQMRFFFEDDSTERVVFDLAAEVGDSLIFLPPHAPAIVVVELISHDDSSTVPAGTFPDVLDFLLTSFTSGARSHYEFAANIGIIRQRGQNQELVLKGARVNGREYGVITGVEANNFNWIQIKRSFILPKEGG